MKKRIIRFYKNNVEERDDDIIEESWITINIKDKQVFRGIVLDEAIEYFVTGFLISEGFIKSKDDIETLSVKNHIANVILKRETSPKNREDKYLSQVENNLKITKEVIFKIGEDFDSLGKYYKTTGGVHIAALYNISGDLLFYFEDISRRNAFDKVIGKAVTGNLDLKDKILMTSGRMSSDIIKKIARANIPVIVSKSAPTDVAIETADKLNITVIGFLRGERFNLYTNKLIR